MVLSTVKRRTLLALWPDLTALPSLQKKHQEKMAELQATQLTSAVPLAVFDDSSPQVVMTLPLFSPSPFASCYLSLQYVSFKAYATFSVCHTCFAAEGCGCWYARVDAVSD